MMKKDCDMMMIYVLDYIESFNENTIQTIFIYKKSNWSLHKSSDVTTYNKSSFIAPS